ncbi:hypothetical protein N656DRAFT_46955 [Canariomyces notabilis]|uniref:Uncharacterized protein n=1 Tax=Canariomyces notabilis TaxID=2074819 RepID=A0AAN6TN70_9PEZI|nr:hypothetical protein N656DRAFT_46955 [Canariomyces arenarius]
MSHALLALPSIHPAKPATWPWTSQCHIKDWSFQVCERGAIWNYTHTHTHIHSSAASLGIDTLFVVGYLQLDLSHLSHTLLYRTRKRTRGTLQAAKILFYSFAVRAPTPARPCAHGMLATRQQTRMVYLCTMCHALSSRQ